MPQRRFNDNYFNDTTPVSADTFNPIVAEFDKAILALETFRFDAEEQVALFNANALKRFNDAIAPVVDQIRTAADGGFLVAETADNVALVQGQQVSFYVPPEARVAYRPTPFLAIMAPATFEDWAMARRVSYNEATGLLVVQILYLHGSGSQRAGWVVSASSGVVDAVYQWLLEARAARDTAIAAAEATATAQQSASFVARTLTKINDLFAMTVRYAHRAKLSADAAAASAASVDGPTIARRRWVLGLLTLKADKTRVYRKTETYSRAESDVSARRRANASRLFT